MTKTVAPYGTWTSPLTPALLVEQAVGLSHLTCAHGRLFWVESRPSEAGRRVLVTAPMDGGQPVDLTPSELSVRTQVHEYGGRCYAVGGDLVVFSNWSDQRLWAMPIDCGSAPRPLTPEPASPRAVRFADPVITAGRHWVICVRETHGDGIPANELVAIRLAHREDDRGEGDWAEPIVLAFGHDFYAAPRLSPDGSRLGWVTWDLPDMPWDGSELWVADLDSSADTIRVSSPWRVAGGRGESITQPRWAPDGTLHYVSDRTGWWNIYTESGDPVCPTGAEFGEPDWVFGNATYGFDPVGELVAAWSGETRSHLGRVAGKEAQPSELPLTTYSSVQPIGEGVVYAIAASPTEPAAVVRLGLDDGSVRVVRASQQVPVDATYLSRPRAVEFPTGGGETAHALFYPPSSRDFTGPEGEAPPLVVILHGGPTSSTSAVLNLAVQYWTTRGFAVADVDHRGSSGYGRRYRSLLDGRWGEVDVEDCASVVGWLADQGLADGKRAVIRGGSAGGFTVLAALAFTDVFAAGASLYGISDLALLASDTHKFESRYTDGLVGPLPEASEIYRARSPIHHVDRINSPLILFQGLEDMVVPPAQSELMYNALKARGVPVAYLTFAGEQHGFRKAETIVEVARAELEFYGQVLGFSPAGEAYPLEIANREELASPPP